jgi:tetratricopeptide (TPR) repeat protein
MRSDPSERVHLEAVRGLTTVGSINQANALHDQMGPRENDRSVREAAWQVLAKLFKGDDFTDKALTDDWAERFKNDPPKRLVVFQTAREKVVKQANNPGADRKLANIDQTIGEIQSTLQQWDQAAASFRNAIQYWQGQKNQARIIAQLTTQYLTALLRAGSYPEAAQYAAARNAADPQEQRSVSFLMRDEVDRLRKAGDGKAAKALIEEIVKMDPPLPETWLQQIKQMGEEIK